MKRSDRRKDAQLERQLAKALGFTKPWKSTPVTLDGVAKNANGDKKPQSTRLLKAECGECGYTVRVTKKWLEAKGAPICPCTSCSAASAARRARATPAWAAMRSRK